MRPALQAALQFALDSRRYDAILHLGRRPGVLVTAFDHSTGEPAVRFRLTFDLEVHDFVELHPRLENPSQAQIRAGTSGATRGDWQAAIVRMLIQRRALLQAAADANSDANSARIPPDEFSWICKLPPAEFQSLMAELENSRTSAPQAALHHALVVIEHWRAHTRRERR